MTFSSGISNFIKAATQYVIQSPVREEGFQKLVFRPINFDLVYCGVRQNWAEYSGMGKGFQGTMAHPYSKIS